MSWATSAARVPMRPWPPSTSRRHRQFPSRTGASGYNFTSSYDAPWLPFSVGTQSPPTAVTARAVRRCVCIASAVTTRPFGVGIPNSAGTAAIPFDLPSTRICPNTGRASSANAYVSTGCGGDRGAAAANDRRNALPSMAAVPPPNPAARPSAGRGIARCRPPGYNALKGSGEDVAARNAVRKPHEAARKPLPGTAEALHVGAAPAAARRRRETDHRHPVRIAERRSGAGPQHPQIYEQTPPCRLSTYTRAHNMN